MFIDSSKHLSCYFKSFFFCKFKNIDNKQFFNKESKKYNTFKK